LATRRAQALLALVAGRPVGAVILSQGQGEGHLRLLHALDTAPEAAPALLERAEDLLRQNGARHLGGSLPLASQDSLAELLRRRGYQVTPRARLVLDLAGAGPAFALPPGAELLPWEEGAEDAAAALLEAAHRDTADITLHPEFAGLEGARQLLQAVHAGRYGRFDPALARMAWAGGQLAGLALNVWHAALAQQGFILDLAVAAAHRRRGLGRALVAATARAFREAGAPALALAVTLENRPAVALYEGLGFQVEQHFCVVQKDLP
jgi:ribosomal protein S18 acetylase RimI-like enzyme